MTEREMFEAALEQPLERRRAYLDGLCGADVKLAPTAAFIDDEKRPGQQLPRIARGDLTAESRRIRLRTAWCIHRPLQAPRTNRRRWHGLGLHGRTDSAD